MVPHGLYEVLFGQRDLPGELKNEANRKKLTSYIDAVIRSAGYERHSILLNEGHTPDYIYFIEKGVARGYYYNEEKKRDVTMFFWEEQSIVLEAPAFFQRKPSTLSIEVIPGSQVLSVSYQQLAEIIKTFPYTEIFTKCVSWEYASYLARRNNDLITLRSWERVLEMLHRHPSIEQKVPKHIIATYVNVTPSTLSRLYKQHRHP